MHRYVILILTFGYLIVGTPIYSQGTECNLSVSSITDLLDSTNPDEYIDLASLQNLYTKLGVALRSCEPTRLGDQANPVPIGTAIEIPGTQFPVTFMVEEVEADFERPVVRGHYFLTLDVSLSCENTINPSCEYYGMGKTLVGRNGVRYTSDISNAIGFAGYSTWLVFQVEDNDQDFVLIVQYPLAEPVYFSIPTD